MAKARNLDSLIREYQDADLIGTIEKGYQNESGILLELDQIRFNPIVRNQFFLNRNLKELTESIRESGVLSPLLVRRRNYRYEVVSGYRRFYVARNLHLERVPVVVREISDDVLIYLVLSRAAQKTNDNILNRTYIFDILVNEYNVSRKDIAKISKISLSQVNNILRLRNLSEDVVAALKKEKISYGQARVLVNLGEEKQKEYLRRIIEENLSVHDIENIAKREKRSPASLKEIEAFESKNKAGVHIGKKTLHLKFKKNSDLKRFIKTYFNDFK